MLYFRKVPCSACPFSRVSRRGHIGPYDSARDMIVAGKEGNFACVAGPELGDPDALGAVACAGAAIMAARAGYPPGNAEIADYQDFVNRTDGRIMDEQEIMQYHSRD